MATITKDEIDARVAGRTVLTEFRRTIELYSDRTALRWIDDHFCLAASTTSKL